MAIGAPAADASTGTLMQQPGAAGCISAGNPPPLGGCGFGRAVRRVSGVAVSLDGTSAYAAAGDGGRLVVFDRDLATGTLTQKAGTAGCIAPPDLAAEFGCAVGRGVNASTLTVSPDGRNVYAVGSTVAILDRDPATGALTQHPGTAGCISETGESKPNFPATAGECTDGRGLLVSRGVSVSADGHNVYVATEASDGVAIFDRDPVTGALAQKPGAAGCITDDGSPVGAPPPSGEPDTRVRECADGNALQDNRSIAISPDGSSVYLAAIDSDAVTVFDRDPATGALAQKPGAGGCVSEIDGSGCALADPLETPLALAVSPDGEDLYVASHHSYAVTAFDRDPASGGLRQKAGTGGCISESGNRGACGHAVALEFASSLAVSPDGRSVYVGTFTIGETGIGDGLAVIDRDPVSGALAQKPGAAGCISDDGTGPDVCASGRALATLAGVTVSPDGRNVYTSSVDDSAVGVFDREPAEGTPPETTIVSGPAEGATTSDGTPTFGFASSEAGASFRCRIDGGVPFGCGSPVTTAPLGAGLHSFSVAAIDPNGNADPTPATRSFSVVQTAPPPPRQDVTPRPSEGGRTITGTSGNDRLVGTPGNDVINCGDGDDMVIAGGGDDVINCGAGDDVVDGGAGNDRISGGSGSDRLSGGSGRDSLVGNGGRDRLSGSSGNDRLSGGSGNDRLHGGPGRDRLLGGSGRDILVGGPGRDRLNGGPGRDRQRQ